MATIGLDKLFYSKITEGENGDETYAAPVALAKAMTAELSVELYMLDSSPFVFTGSAPQLGKIRHRARHKHTGHKITVRFIKVLLSQQ